MEPLFKIGEKVQAKCRDGKIRLAQITHIEVRKPFAGLSPAIRDVCGPNKDKTLIYYKVNYLSKDNYDIFKTLNIHLEEELKKN